MTHQATFLTFNSTMRDTASTIIGVQYEPFFDSMKDKINIWWNAGETVESAQAMMISFADGHNKKTAIMTLSKTPKQCAISYTVI